MILVCCHLAGAKRKRIVNNLLFIEAWHALNFDVAGLFRE
jgi:hypothetical protein